MSDRIKYRIIESIDGMGRKLYIPQILMGGAWEAFENWYGGPAEFTSFRKAKRAIREYRAPQQTKERVVWEEGGF